MLEVHCTFCRLAFTLVEFVSERASSFAFSLLTLKHILLGSLLFVPCYILIVFIFYGTACVLNWQRNIVLGGSDTRSRRNGDLDSSDCWPYSDDIKKASPGMARQSLALRPAIRGLLMLNELSFPGYSLCTCGACRRMGVNPSGALLRDTARKGGRPPCLFLGYFKNETLILLERQIKEEQLINPCLLLATSMWDRLAWGKESRSSVWLPSGKCNLQCSYQMHVTIVLVSWKPWLN